MSTSKDSVFWVGIDLHQSSLMLAAYRGWASEPEVYRELDSRSPAVGRVIRGLQKKARVSAVYEASGCGYWLARRMKRWGVDCQVVAPSLIPRLAGDRVKTDKRDAQKLATMHRADVLTYVRVPSLEEERVRRLVRAREGIRRDIHRSKQRILKVLQSLGHVYEPGKKKWTQAYWRWLRGLKLHAEERESLALMEAELEVQLAQLVGVSFALRQSPAVPVEPLHERCEITHLLRGGAESVERTDVEGVVLELSEELLGRSVHDKARTLPPGPTC